MSKSESKIEAELVEITELSNKRGEDREGFVVRLMDAVNGLSDDDWKKLSKPAQTWFNDVVDVQNENRAARKSDPKAEQKALPEPPDLPKKEESTGRRRGGDDDSGKAEESALKVGVQAKLTTKRGKVYEGKVVEIDGDVIVIKTEDGEEEVNKDRLDKTEIIHGGGKSKDEADEPADPIKVGAQVKVVTKRGKEIVGKITELDDEVMVLKTEDGEEELQRTRIESVQPVGGKASGRGKSEDKEEPSGRRRGGDDDSGDKGKAEEKTGRTRSTNGGVSIGQRIKELIAADLEGTVADIAKALKKEGLEFKENTLDLNYAEMHKAIKALREAGHMKK